MGFFDNWNTPAFLKRRPSLDEITTQVTEKVTANLMPDVDEITDEELYDENVLNTFSAGSDRSKAIANILQKLRETTDDRKTRFKEYDELTKDPIIGQVMEMMADDSTQFDVERERTVWIESKDKDYEDKVNAMLKRYIEPFVDTVAFSILEVGEFAFKVIPNNQKPLKPDVPAKGKVKQKEDKSKNKKNEDPFSLVPFIKIWKLNHLIMQDNTHWFVVTDDMKGFAGGTKDKEKQFLHDDEFLHFINYSLKNSQEVEMMVYRGTGTERNRNKGKEPIFILQGQALLTENIREVYQIIRALEDAIIASRLDKSKMVRFVNVQVGKMTNQAAKNLVNYIDGLITKNESISPTADVYSASRQQAEPVTVVVPVKAEKGAITVEQFENTADIKELADLDHFMEKLFVGLRTPKQFVGYGESLPGIGNSASLMRMDIRYARSVKKVQRVVV